MSLRLSSFLGTSLALLLLATWPIADTLGEILHLQPDIVLDFLQGLRIHKLRERIQLLLVKQSQKVIAKSTHFTVPIRHEVLEHSGRTRNACEEVVRLDLHLSLQSCLLRR